MGGNSFTLFVSPHLWGGGIPARPSQPGGGTPCWEYPTSGTPPSDLAGGYPLLGLTHLRYPPCQTWMGGYPCQGVPHLGYPSPPCWTWPGGTLLRETDGVLDTPRSVCLLRSRWRTFLFFKNFEFYHRNSYQCQ